MANTYLRHTEGTSPTDARKFTFSTWIKRSKLGTDQTIFYNYKSSSNFAQIYFRGPQKDIRYFDRVGGGDTCVGTTAPMLFNDVNGWYNIVLKVDTTQSASADKVQFYINGEYLAFNFDNVPNTNQALTLNNWGVRTIGANNDGGNNFDGLMSYVAFIDGTAESANIFGETDTTTGQWKIKTTITPSVAWGNTGFWVLKDGNSVTDQSGNGNNFTASGNLTKSEDCPSNVFNILNPLDNYYSNYTYNQGNTAVASTSSDRTYVTSTLAMPSGKYYWECKLDATIGDSGGASTSVYVGITGQSPISPSQFPSDGTCFNCVMNTNGQVYSNGSTIGSAMGSSWATSTFVMMAYDADNNKMYFGKDGVWLNSGDPTSGATGTGAFTPTTAASATPIGVYMPQWGVDFNASYGTSFNFGNGYFGTTAVASAGTNASGIGIFEYNVPAGYTALSTKGLNL